ncbi:MAG: response regulator [Melioribacteraceae bacterium]|nr:response regulator [Melioribacteraceae bacterium]
MYFNDKPKILVIDDSDIIRTSMAKFLSEYDVEVLTCNDGLEGLQCAVEEKPQLIFLDLLMPNLDGLRLLKVIKVLEDLKSIPIIIISGHTDKTNVLAAMEAGAEKIISKPLTKEALIKAINEVLGNDFLTATKKLANFSQAEKEKLNKELKKYFATSLIQKKQSIKESIQNKNKELLKLIVHELKGSAGTAGFQQVSELCKEFENVLLHPSYSWEEINSKSQNLLSTLTQIEQNLLN